ncbi:hypothetical protein ACFLYL_01785 [Chloroflexota bacterium]
MVWSNRRTCLVSQKAGRSGKTMLTVFLLLLCLLLVSVYSCEFRPSSVPVLSPTQKTTGIVTFPDPYLEAAIRQAIKKPEGNIYKSDLEALTVFLAVGRNISKISGLE